MWPLDVAGADGKYFLIVHTVEYGTQVRCPALIALSRIDGLELHMI